MPASIGTISIVGAETPIGRELRERLQELKLAAQVQSIGAEDEVAGILTEIEGEPVVMTPLDADRLSGSEVVLCSGSARSTLKALELLGSPRQAAIIDLTSALDDQPAARLRAPLLEEEGTPLPADVIHVVPHPAAIAAASVLRRLHTRHPIERCVLQILEPASERGQSGMNELQQQTSSLLTFQTLKKAVFDAQVSFNLLPRYGEDAPEQLGDIELRIDRHLASLLASSSVPMPSLRLVQAPVFHGYSMSFWIELLDRPSIQAVEEALASAQIEVREADLDPPSNIGVVGQGGVTVGAIELDRHNPRALWLWGVADNYRVRIDNAVAIVQDLPVERRG